MKILQISHQLPYPPDSGGKMVVFNTATKLIESGQEVHLVSLSNQRQKEAEIELAKHCKITTIYNNSDNQTIPMILNLFSPNPYNLSKYHNQEFLRLIESVVESFKPDIIHLEQLHVAYAGLHIKKIYKIPMVLREHNVESTIMYRFALTQTNPLRKYYAFHQYRKLYEYEKKVCAEVDLCIPITSVDEFRLQEMNPECKTFVVPAGVDTNYFYPWEDAKVDDYTIVHVGAMNWLPNIDGMQWFVKNVFPRIKKILPNAKLYIVGGNPPTEITSLEDKDIIVTGYVDDVRDYFAKAAVSIVPLRIGGGMRIKILDSLAMGKAVVSTSIGCEGIDVENGKNILIADSPEQFANHVINLLKSSDLRTSLGNNGLKLVQEKYSWESVIGSLLKAYRTIIG